jgi:hypothetical protein
MDAEKSCPDADGTMEEREHLYKVALEADTPEKQAKIFNAGGAGSFARPTEYVQILAALLNGGVSAKTGNRILKEETIDQMWENHIPQWPDFARGNPPPAVSTLKKPRWEGCKSDVVTGRDANEPATRRLPATW